MKVRLAWTLSRRVNEFGRRLWDGFSSNSIHIYSDDNAYDIGEFDNAIIASNLARDDIKSASNLISQLKQLDRGWGFKLEMLMKRLK